MGGVTTSGGPVTGLDQLRTVTRAEVAVPAGPVSIDLSVSTVQGGILDCGEPRRPVTLLRRQISRPGRAVTMVRGNIASDGMVQDPVHIDVPPRAVAVSLVRRGVPLIRGPVPVISRGVTLVRQPVTLIGRPIPLAHPALSFVRSRFANPYPEGLDHAGDRRAHPRGHRPGTSFTVLRPA